jgi:hypothetical protein
MVDRKGMEICSFTFLYENKMLFSPKKIIGIHRKSSFVLDV